MKKTFLIFLVLLCVAAIGMASASAAGDDFASDDAIQSSMDDNAIEEIISDETDDSIDDSVDDSDVKSLAANNLGDGTTIYVSTTGNDANDGSSEENAVATISHAVDIAGDGSTINIGKGEYTSSYIDIPASKSLSFIGAEKDGVTIKGTGKYFVGLIESGSSLVFKNLIISDIDSTNSQSTGLRIGGDSPLEISNCTFTNINAKYGAIQVYTSNVAKITDCTFKDVSCSVSGGTGALYVTNGNVSVDRCIFDGVTYSKESGYMYGAIYQTNGNLTISNSLVTNVNAYASAVLRTTNFTTNIRNTTFIRNIVRPNPNNNNNYGDAILKAAGATAYLTVEGCNFIENQALYGVIHIERFFGNISHSSFIDNTNVAGGGNLLLINATSAQTKEVHANYNFYGTNDNPSNLVSDVPIDNWVIMSASSSADSVAVGEEITITADFSKYTDGTTTGDVTGTMAEIPVKFVNDDTKGSVSEILYQDNKAIVTYTGVAEGDDSVAVTAASASTTIPITVTAAAPAGNVIYVKPDGNDENDGSSPSTAVATIAKAIEIVDATEGTNFTIHVANGVYNITKIESPEAKNINLIGESKEGTIVGGSGVYAINVYQDNVNWTIENFTFCDFNSSSSTSAFLRCFAVDSNFLVNNCIFRNIGSKNGAIYLTSTGTRRISNCLFEDNFGTYSSSSSVIHLYGEGQVTLDNIEVKGSYMDSSVGAGNYLRSILYADQDQTNIVLMNSRIHDNNGSIGSIIEAKGTFDVINTTIENNYINYSANGDNGGTYLFYSGTSSNSASKINITQSVIKDNTIAGGNIGLFNLVYGTHNIDHSIIMNNKYANGNDVPIGTVTGSTLNVDNNYWGTNDRPNTRATQWVILTADVPEYAFVGVADDIKVYLNTYNTTSGTTGSLEKTMPEITLGASYALSTSNPSTVTIKDGEGTITYTASEAGNETVTLSSGDAFSFKVSADVSTLIYVDGSVETSGTGTSESPFKTIAEALNVAADGKVIIIRSGTYTESDLVIDDDIVVKADKNAVVIIDADNEGRVFIVTSTATIKDLSLTGGMSNDAGGAIFVNGGDLTVNNVNISSCGAGSGGAIGTTAGSNLTVSNSVFSENMAMYGGAIYVAGEANISNCEFNDHEYATYGGAIYVNTTSPVSISSNKFDGNDADKGEAIYIKDGAVTLSGNTIADEETIYLAGGSVNYVLIFLGNSTITSEPGEALTLTATLTDDKGNSIRGGSVIFTADGETIATVDLSGNNAIQTTYTVPADADADIVISGSYTLGSDGTVESGAIHPAIPNWFIEGGSGYETLAEAIAAANDGDIIYGRAGTYTVNGITVSKDITIKANETGTIVLDGGKSKMFTVNSLATLTLLNLDLTNGGTSGGGFASVSSTGTLNIINTTLRDLRPTSAGGAISVTSDGKVNIEGSRFENISSTASSAILSATGASSVITIKDSSFNDINNTNSDYTLMQIAGNVSIERSNFTNIVGKYQNNWYGAVGVTSSGNANVTECQFINVTGGDGSAIYFSSTGNLIVTKSVFMNNKNYRGAIYVNNPASAIINYNLFIGNEAGGSYAADLYKNTRTNQNVNANYNFWGTNSQPTESQITKVEDAPYWTIVDLSSNSDTVYMGTTPAIDVKFIATNGVENVSLEGIMPDYAVDLSASAGSIEPASVTIANNAASATYTPQADGSVTITAAPAGAELVLTVVDPSVLLVVSTAGNDATGAGTFDNPYATIAHALSQVTETRNVIYLVKTDDDYEESDLTVSGNVVIKGEDKTVTIDAGMEGRVFIVTGTLTIEDLSLTGGMTNDAGGAIFVNGGNLTVNNVNISSCGAGSGGAIGTTAESNLTVSNSVFSENMAMYGGAIYVAGEANISNCEFNDHEYGTYGGAIYVNTTSPVSISSNKFNGNDADKGEAIYIQNGAVNLSENTITDEETIYLAGGSVNSVLIFLSNSTVNAEFGETVTLTATLTDDQANPIRGGSVVFTANGETIATVDLSGNNPLQTTYTVPADAAGDIIISGSYSLDNEGTVATGAIHPTVINWFIEGGNGYETLAEAIAAANAGDVIYGNPGTYDVSGITVEKAVTIKANESGSIILNGNGNRIFYTKANVILDNLTLINGSAIENGGLVYVYSGSLAINNSAFKDSQATGGQGSAIYVASGSSNVVIDNSVFDNIKAATALINCRSTSTVFTVTRTNFTNINVSANGVFYLYEGGIRASECQFINISGGEGAAVYFYGQSNNIITKCVFDNVVTSGNAIIYSNGKSANVSYNVFLGINKGLYSSSTYISSAITADYNYWGTNDRPSDYVNANTILNNWVIMTVSPSDIEAIEIDTTQAFTVDFKQYTDGTANYTLADTIPELTVSASAINGALDPSEIATVDNQAIFTYTANVAGEDTVTFTNANVAIPVTFNVSLSPVGVIFVSKDGTATGTGTEEDPVDSIARAIELANEANGKIFIKEGVYTETGFTVSKDLEITGLGNVVIDANNVTAKMFNLLEGVENFKLNNVAITKANQGFGAVLYNNYGANVLFNNVSINESYANGFGNSALIINKGNLSIIDSNISNNGPITCIIYNEGNVTVDNTLFEDNILNTSSTTFGVIYSSGNCTVSIEDSNFTNIDSIRGAIYSKATEGGNLSISNSKFENCSASFENNFGYGGAVYSEVPLTVSDSTFINSKSYKDGAAIYAAKGGEIKNSVFSGGVSENEDTSEIYTGGDLTLTNNVFSAPISDTYVVKAASGASVTATDNWFGTNNVGSVVSGFTPDNWVIMNAVPNSTSTFTGEAIEISIDFKHTNNTAGEIGDFTGSLPGEITVYATSNNGTLVPTEVITDGLEAKVKFVPEFAGENIILLSTGKANDNVPIAIMVNEKYAGPIYVSKDGSDSNEGSETAPVATIAKAIELAQGKSGKIIINEGTYVESGLNITADLNITTVGNVIWDANGNRALDIKAVDVSIANITFINGNSTANGHLIRAIGTTLVIDDCTFANNGGIANSSGVIRVESGDLDLTNCVFENNTGGNGNSYGLVSIESSTLTVDNCNFTNNAFKWGAAFHISSGSIVLVNNSQFIGNTARAVSGGSGGAFYIGATSSKATYALISNSKFINNSATGSSYYGGEGGAIYLNNNVDATIVNCVFENNKVTDNNDGTVLGKGGAITTSGCNLTVKDSIFMDNDGSNGTAINMKYSKYAGSSGFMNITNSIILPAGEGKVIVTDIAEGTFVANSNWWGSNDNPADKLTGITVDNWVIMNVDPAETTISIDGSAEITVDFKHTNSTDGTVASLEGGLPQEFNVSGSANNGTLSPTEATTVDLEAKLVFTPEFAGENIVTIQSGDAAVPVLINVKPLQKETVLSADEEIAIKFGSGSMEVTLTAEGAPVEGKLISVKVNDEITLTGTTNAQGVATIDLSSVPIGTYNAEIKFEGDDEYIGSNAVSKITVSEAPKTSEDLQKLIDETPAGGVLNLSNMEFADISGINITKDIAIVGDNTTISTAGDGTPVFNIPSNVSNVSFSGIDFVANNGDVLVKATAANGTDDLSIVNPAIELTNNTVSPANENVVPSSITLFELESERGVLAPSNEISISNNTLPEGAKAFDFEVAGLSNGSDVNIPKGGNINTNGSSKPVVKLATKIVAKNIKTTTVNTKINGKKAGKNFSITLKDSKGNVLAKKQVLISFNGKIYKRTTNAKGVATVKVALAKKGTYPVVISFLGDDKYNGSFAVAKVKVNPQKVKLTVAKKKYKASKKKKVLTAKLLASNKKAIKGKKLVFIVNKKKYTAKTNKKGIAKVKVKLSRKKTYKVKVRFAGDSTFKKATKKGKVRIV